MNIMQHTFAKLEDIFLLYFWQTYRSHRYLTDLGSSILEKRKCQVSNTCSGLFLWRHYKLFSCKIATIVRIQGLVLGRHYSRKYNIQISLMRQGPLMRIQKMIGTIVPKQIENYMILYYQILFLWETTAICTCGYKLQQ